MIDDYQTAMELMDKMKSSLPIAAYPSNKCVFIFRDKNIKIKASQLLEISDVYYSGDAGGILCSLKFPFETEQAYVVSLTHLRFVDTHPLAKEIRKYQVQRVRNLARQ